MSIQKTHADLRDEFSVSVEGTSHKKTRQALYHENGGTWDLEDIHDRPHDGELLYRYFGIKPFHKALDSLERQEHNVVEYPGAYLDALIHVDDWEKDLLKDGDLDYFREETETPQSRLRILEWVAERPEVLRQLSDGGTDMHAHSKPGKGKTSFGMLPGVVRLMEVNNETVLWPLPADETGKVEEIELLPLAPFMTLLVPEDVEFAAEFVPTNPRLDKMPVDITSPFPFRDVVEYEDPVDILENIVVPGGAYAILPDPKFRRCRRLTATNYNTPAEADDITEVTRLRHWDHALLAARAKADQFLHFSTQVEDEFSDLVPMNPRADASDTYLKTDRWPEVYGKARKKNHSLLAMSHSLQRVDEDVLEKERWFVTMPDTDVPSSVPGYSNPPVDTEYTKGWDVGTAVIWESTNFADLEWVNPYRAIDFRGELNIYYPNWQEALSHV